VLLECDEYYDAHTHPASAAGPTAGATLPRPLTPAEKAALQAVFEPHLAWPPRVTPAEPLQLRQAARRLDITASAVKVRLEGARAKAELLGLERPAGVTDPAYLYVLVAQLSQGTGCNHFHQVEARLARWLLMTHDRMIVDEFNLTQEFLSHMLGVRREAVSRSASELQNRNLIRYSRGTLKILDRQGLEKTSCGCYETVRDEPNLA